MRLLNDERDTDCRPNQSIRLGPGRPTSVEGRGLAALILGNPRPIRMGRVIGAARADDARPIGVEGWGAC